MKNKVVDIKEGKKEEAGGYNITLLVDGVNYEYNDILGYQVGAQWVAVSMKDGSTYVYPASSVFKIIHSPIQKAE